VETPDGYLLTIHRIPGNESIGASNGKPVVLLQHGILGSSADWVMLGPNQSLGKDLSLLVSHPCVSYDLAQLGAESVRGKAENRLVRVL
jgi:pimeloyl-ACP methyl ester carboxylesterase